MHGRRVTWNGASRRLLTSTRMFVPGYGFAIAADCGGGVKGNMIDLGYPDGVEVDWSSHWVDIYILG